MSLRSNVTMLHGTSKCPHRLEPSFQEELTVKKGDVLGFYGVLGFAIVSFYCIQQVGNGGASWVALVVKHRWHFEFPSLIKNQWYARLKHKGRHCHVLFWLLGMVIDNECWQVDSFVFYLLGWLKHLCWLSSGCVTTSCKVTQGEMNTKKVPALNCIIFIFFFLLQNQTTQRTQRSQHLNTKFGRSKSWSSGAVCGDCSLVLDLYSSRCCCSWPWKSGESPKISNNRRPWDGWNPLEKDIFFAKISGIFNVLSGKSYRYDGLMCLLFCWRFIKNLWTETLKCPGFKLVWSSIKKQL